MKFPPWLTLLVAAAVILFASYRLWLAFAGPSDEARRGVRRGMLAMPRRQHGAIGVLFLLVAGALIATSFGWNPFQRATTTKAPAAGSGSASSPAKPAAGLTVE